MHKRDPKPEECAKCFAVSKMVQRKDYPIDSPEHIFGSGPLEDPFYWLHDQKLRDFVSVYECPTHGHYGILPDGEIVFAEPDIWVDGTNGKRLFRI